MNHNRRDYRFPHLAMIGLLLMSLMAGCNDTKTPNPPDKVTETPPKRATIILSGTNWKVTQPDQTVEYYDARRQPYSVSFDWGGLKLRMKALANRMVDGTDTLEAAEFRIIAEYYEGGRLNISIGSTAAPTYTYPQGICLPVAIFLANGKPAYTTLARPQFAITLDPAYSHDGPVTFDLSQTPPFTLSDSTYLGPVDCVSEGLHNGHNPFVMASRDGNDIVILVISTIIEDADPQVYPYEYDDINWEIDPGKARTANPTATDGGLHCNLTHLSNTSTELYVGEVANTKFSVPCNSVLRIDQNGTCNKEIDLTQCGAWICIQGSQVKVLSNCSSHVLACSNL
jgi:hypothetical protein